MYCDPGMLLAPYVPFFRCSSAYYTERKLKNKKIKTARLEARPGSIYLMSDVNTNVSDVGGRSLSKLEAFCVVPIQVPKLRMTMKQ